MAEKTDIEYRPLISGEDNDNGSKTCNAGKIRKCCSKFRKPTIIILCVLLEVIHILICFGGYAAIQRFQRSQKQDLDGLVALMQFNTTQVFINDNKYTEDSEFADEYWKNMAPQSAIVSLNADWAAANGIPPSSPTPDTPGEMVYQIDVFHSLHCLYRIRKRLLGNETHPRDGHTLHCLNYLRQSFQCNPDLMLGTTTTYEDYGLHNTHVCRDYKAIEGWVERHRWKGFWEWANNKPEEMVTDPSLLDPDSPPKTTVTT